MNKVTISKFYSICEKEYFKSTMKQMPYTRKEITKQFFNNKLKLGKINLKYYFSIAFIKNVAKKLMPKTYAKLKKLLKK